MRCPRCGADGAAAASFCTRCGESLVALPPSAPEAMTVPLTAEQLSWLKTNTILPILVLLPILAGVVLMAVCVGGRFINSPFVKGFAVIAGLLLLGGAVVVALHVRSHRADARAGVAQVRVAQLLRKRMTSQSPRVFYAEFEQIGSLNVMHELYQQLVEGQRYRVTYSPQTRRAWSIEPPPAARH